MTVELFKKKNGHEIDGWWFPRVTSIIDVLAKDGLLRYYANHRNLSDAKESLRNAANRGIMVHNIVEELVRGNKINVPASIQPSIKAFRKWADKHFIKILDPEHDIERQIFNREYSYSGVLDMIAEIDGVLGVLDIKTSGGIWNEYSLQTAAYLYAYNKLVPKERQAKTRWILRIDQYQECVLCGAKKRLKEGRVRITGGNPFCHHKFSPKVGIIQFKELSNFKDDFQAFLHAKGIWEWKNRNWLLKIDNYIGKQSFSRQLSFR